MCQNLPDIGYSQRSEPVTCRNRTASWFLSASDLVNFLECGHLTSLDLIDLDTPLPRAQDV